METIEIQKQVEVLNDLVQINNDRIAGYEKAIKELDENNGDLVSLFQGMVNDSKDYNEELEKMVNMLDGESAEGTSGAGKIYRAWMDVKAFFTGGDRKTVLSNCEAGEDAAQRAYKDALNEKGLSPEVYNLIASQKAALLDAHDEIKALREALF